MVSCRSVLNTYSQYYWVIIEELNVWLGFACFVVNVKEVRTSPLHIKHIYNNNTAVFPKTLGHYGKRKKK